MLITFAQLFSRFRAELYLKTPAALERRAADERLAASFALARRARVGRMSSFNLRNIGASNLS
jgi:hypothetical protein